jgi:hypothetical protein
MAEVPSDQRKPLLLFVHIPKTAGTTLKTILNVNEPGGRSRALGNVFKGAGGAKQGVTFRRLLDDRNTRDLERLRVVTGHIPLGMRDQLSKDRDVRCFTFLREPADRTLSHYFGIRIRRQGSHKPGRYARSALPAEPTLDDMLEGGYIHDNLHTRMLSGLPEPFGEVTEEMLERAKRNLREELVFFGLTERFDESLVLAKRRLGLTSVLYKSHGSAASAGRVNTSRPRGEEVPEDLMRAAERCNRYDIELYRYAEALFERAPELGELEFKVELAALRAARGDGEIELEAAAPESFGGDEEAWRMLLRATVMLLRHQRELAEIKALTYELGEDDEEILKKLQSVRTRGKRVADCDADAAFTRVIQLLGKIGAALPADGRASAPPQPKEPASSPSKRATRRRKSSAGSRGRAKRKSATPAAGARQGRASGALSSRKRNTRRRRSTGRASAGDGKRGRVARKGRKRSAGES